MSLDMYLGETDNQTKSMNIILIEIIQSMEQVIKSIDSFAGAVYLQGKTYSSAKMYVSTTFRTLAQGMITLCEELIRQNDTYPNEFRSQVATTDVMEQDLRMQISKLKQLIEKIEAISLSAPMLAPSISIYRQIKRFLEKKLEQLLEYNIVSRSNYDLALELAEGIMTGLNSIKNGKAFNHYDGTFSTEGMNLDWITKLVQTQNKIKVQDTYPGYLEENEYDGDSVEKVLVIMEYEKVNPENVKDTNQFLSHLKEGDIVEIKYAMYTADEPYRTLATKYLDRFEIDSITESGVFRPSEDSVSFDIEAARKDSRGGYYTVFHEIGHAIDYYSGQDKGVGGNFSSEFEIDGQNLNDHIYNDVENNFKQEIKNELQSSKYNHLSDVQKRKAVQNITENFMNQDELHQSLSDEERKISREVRKQYRYDILEGATHNTASDIYGAVTNFFVQGSYGHQNEDGAPSEYWFVDGERIREPNKEAFAEYYGRIMVPDGKEKQAGIDSIEEFLPSSKEHMDEIFDAMMEGDSK